MKRKKKIFQTCEEREAWEAEGEDLHRRLRERIAKIDAELAAKRKTA